MRRPNMSDTNNTTATASSALNPAPVPVPGPISETELAKANGTNGGPLYIAVKDPFSPRIVVFDVTSGADFYGPGSPYNVFVGRDATHGLAKSSIDPNQVFGDLEKLTASEKDTHMQWFAKYTSKYPQIGWLEHDYTVAQPSSKNGAEGHTERNVSIAEVTAKMNGVASAVKDASPNGVAKAIESDVGDADGVGATNESEEEDNCQDAETQDSEGASTQAPQKPAVVPPVAPVNVD